MRPIVWLCWSACGLVACTRESTPLPLVGTLERDRIEIVAEANERIAELLVIEGDRVEADQVLARLDDSLVRVEIKRAAAARDMAAARLAELVRGPREEQIREGRARLEGAQNNRAIADREFARVRELVDRQLASDLELDTARNRLESATAEVEALRASLDALLDGTTIEELDQAKAQLAQAEAALEAAQVVASRYEIVAPRAGVIDALPYKLGARPPARATMIVMLADQAPFARIYVPETIKARVGPGLAATVRVDGMPQLFDAVVRYVASEAAFTPYFALTERDRGRLSFVAEVTLTDGDARGLPVGTPVEVDFPSLR
jgi:HlyD family secretion protein